MTKSMTIKPMTMTNATMITPPPARRKPGKLTGWLRRHLARLLDGVREGELTVILPDGTEIVGGGTGPTATIVLHRWRPLLRLLVEGDLGFAESYIAGDWSTPDLLALLILAARNEAAIGNGIAGTGPARLLARLGHLARANTRRGSRRNIRAHYDLGNDFYAAWLDAGMTYSSALYARDGMTLEDAQAMKQDRVLEMLDARPGSTVLEIGCGWGGLMERIAEIGAAVTGLTLSPAQADYARDRLALAGLPGMVRLEDYREAAGEYDRIVSVEMFEAVGQERWSIFFETLRRRLKSGGSAVLQVITIDESRFAAYARQADFIQAHIFPGGMLPTRTLIAEAARKAGFAPGGTEWFGASYAATLAAWAARFEAAWPSLSDLGFDERFRRKWRYYLAYCEAGFRTGALDVGLYRFIPERRRVLRS